MPASSIAQILLRIFALEWVIGAVIQIFYMRMYGGYGGPYWREYAPSLIWLVAGLLLWASAPVVSKIASKGNDGGFTLKGVTERALYATAFLGLGLYFALKSFAAVFSWLHHHAVARNVEFSEAVVEPPSYYTLSESVLTFGAGIGLVLTCRIWAAKMTRGEIAPLMD